MEIRKRICDKCKTEIGDCEPYYDIRIDRITYFQNGATMDAMKERMEYGEYCIDCFKKIKEME